MSAARPRVLVVSTSFSHDSTGQEAAGGFVRDFVLKLAERADVTVIAPSLQPGILQQPSYRVRYFPVARLPLSLLSPLNPRDWLPIARALRAGRAEVAAAVASAPFDLIVALWVLPCGYWAKSAGAGTPYVTWALGSDIWTLGRLPVVRQILRRVLRSARKNYADGMELADMVRQIGGGNVAFLPSSRLLPVPLERGLKRTEPPYRLAFLGRWHPNKGPDLLLEALSLLTDQEWSRIESVHFAGGGALEPAVRAAVARLQAQGRPVQLEGFMNADEAAALIGWADYLLLPSRVESIPVIFSDALQAGTPLIATPVGDLPALHRLHEFGVLARRVTAPDFARAIATAVASRPDVFAPALKRLHERFDLDGVVAELLTQAARD
jgi:glycosyltransferase involved in cell wall biosynthesis